MILWDIMCNILFRLLRSNDLWIWWLKKSPMVQVWYVHNHQKQSLADHEVEKALIVQGIQYDLIRVFGQFSDTLLSAVYTNDGGFTI